MEDISTYHIQFAGQISPDEINTRSPLTITAAGSKPGASCFTVRTDQSGIVGLIRHLHGEGFVLLAVERIMPTATEGA